MMTDEEKMIALLTSGACAYCGSKTTGKYSLHRDGFGQGPEVDLCDFCGGPSGPTLEEIWDVISQIDQLPENN